LEINFHGADSNLFTDARETPQRHQCGVAGTIGASESKLPGQD